MNEESGDSSGLDGLSILALLKLLPSEVDTLTLRYQRTSGGFSVSIDVADSAKPSSQEEPSGSSTTSGDFLRRHSEPIKHSGDTSDTCPHPNCVSYRVRARLGGPKR